jgi:MoaA/NifB/PqqE/SkfB family radical SAM enzyme
MVTEEHIKTLKEANISNIQVSLYSLNPVIHDFITNVPGSFDRTFRTIHRFIEEDIPITISCPITKYNYKDYYNIFDWASEHRIKTLTTIELIAQYDGNKDNLSCAPTCEMIREFLIGMLKKDKKWRENNLNYFDMRTRLNKNLNENICAGGVSLLYITHIGGVLPCSGWDSYLVGDLNNQPLREIWEQSLQLKELRNLKKCDYPDYINSKYKEFIFLCPAKFAIQSGGNYLKITEDTIMHAKLTNEVVENYIHTEKIKLDGLIGPQ